MVVWHCHLVLTRTGSRRLNRLLTLLSHPIILGDHIGRLTQNPIHMFLRLPVGPFSCLFPAATTFIRPLDLFDAPNPRIKFAKQLTLASDVGASTFRFLLLVSQVLLKAFLLLGFLRHFWRFFLFNSYDLCHPICRCPFVSCYKNYYRFPLPDHVS
jgi:hypothetical protein